MRRLFGSGLLLPVVAAAILPGLHGCEDAAPTLPRPYPPNIVIAAQPASGAVVDPAALDSVVLDFSRAMDPVSLRYLRRVSFLLPLTVTDIEPAWNAARTRAVFDLGGELPVQPGTTYDALFAGLRTAEGDLYNLGPYRVRFRTRGLPDLLPMRPATPFVARAFCHRLAEGTTTCDFTGVLAIETHGTDSLAHVWTCDEPHQRPTEYFRWQGRTLRWLGFEAAGRAPVRWPAPPPLCVLPPTPGTHLLADPQASPDGTRLLRWEVDIRSRETPTHAVRVDGLPVDLEFTDSTVLDVRCDLEPPGGEPEIRRERWWLYPGVGLVRREIRVTRGDVSTFELQAYRPPVPSAD